MSPLDSFPSQRQISEESSLPPSSLKCHDLRLTVPKDVLTQHAPQIVIAHRGASTHLPEHSLAAYRLALELGADYIEPDLVATKDQQLIAIHSLDLSLTTNVAEVFGEERKTISAYMGNQTGYWAYDFTLHEIQQLTLRQRLPDARSTVFDGLFRIPTLKEILKLLIEWNEQVQPYLYNLNGTTAPSGFSFNRLVYPPPPRGMYAELKDSPWLLQDTKMNLLDIFFQSMHENQELWRRSMWQYMCDTKLLKEHQYKLPVLIMQAFQAPILQDFTTKWRELAGSVDETLSLTTTVPDPENPSLTLTLPLPVPPTILLVPYESCQQEEYWFEIEDKYREYIRGIGIEKRCFFVLNEETEVPGTQLQYLPTIMEKARKADWVVHPWTERPETEFFVHNDLTRRQRRQSLVRNLQEDTSTVLSSMLSPFTTVMEELMFFKCKVGVQGIFSESVDTAVRAMNMDCPDGNEGVSGGSGMSSTQAECPDSSSNSDNIINNSSSGGINKDNIPLGPVILLSFILGIFSALLVGKVWSVMRRRQGEVDSNGHSGDDVGGIMMINTNNTRRLGGKKHSALPTSEDDDDHHNDMSFTPVDHEML
jgi:glycerophosphoryl diester phosphodiesterase